MTETSIFWLQPAYAIYVNQNITGRHEEIEPRLIVDIIRESTQSRPLGLCFFWQFNVKLKSELFIESTIFQKTMIKNPKFLNSNILLEKVIEGHSLWWDLFSNLLLDKGVVLARPIFTFNQNQLAALFQDLTSGISENQSDA